MPKTINYFHENEKITDAIISLKMAREGIPSLFPAFLPKPHFQLEDLIKNLDTFLPDDFIHISNPLLFIDDARPLLDALLRRQSITEINLNWFNDIYHCGINMNFADFIAESKSLKKVDISRDCISWNARLLPDKYLIPIVYGLERTCSLEELNLSGYVIHDRGLHLLLEAVKSNQQCPLKFINFCQCTFTNEGLLELEEFLKTSGKKIECNLHLITRTSLGTMKDAYSVYTGTNVVLLSNNTNTLFNQSSASAKNQGDVKQNLEIKPTDLALTSLTPHKEVKSL